MKIQSILLPAVCFLLLKVNSWAGIIHSMEFDGTAYFFMDFPARVECYNLSNRTWTAAIDLPGTHGNLSAGWIDADGLYIAYGQAAYRYDLLGSNEVHLVNVEQSIHQILSDDNLLFLNRSGSLYARMTSIDKDTNTLIANFENYIDSVMGASIAPSIDKIFGRSSGVSPSDITFVNYNSDGTFAGGGDSPHHGDYPSASRTWVFPDAGKVVDNSGTIYSASSLTYLKSFGSSITDLVFYGDEIPILLNGSTLTAYTSSILPTGNVALDHAPTKIYVNGNDVLTFTLDNTASRGITARTLPLSSLNPPTPGDPIDPAGLPFIPDSSFVDKEGILHLFSKANQSIFRWDTKTQQYANTIPLVGVPEYAAYSPDNHAIYTAYASGLIREIKLGNPAYAETPFASLPSSPLGLSTAGPYIFGCDASGAWESHYTFNNNGTQVSAVDWNYPSKEFIWNDANQKMYFFRDGTSPNDLLWEEINADGTTYPALPPGGIGAKTDSPLHSSSGFSNPIRVAPNGSVVVLGSGVIHDAATLARLTTSLANSVLDVAWLGLGNDVYTVRTISGVTQYQQWLQPTLGQGIVKQYPGEAHRLIGISDTNFVGVSINSNCVPLFYILDSAFDIVAPDGLVSPSGIQATAVSTSRVDIVWFDVTGETSYRIERRTDGSASWIPVGTTGASEVRFSDASVALGHAYEYRVIAVNGATESSPSSISSVALKVPETPLGLHAATVSSREIAVSWNDVLFETSYTLQRKTGELGPWIPIMILPADTVAFTNTALAPDTEYFYRITAISGWGSSPVSEAVHATTDLEVPTRPGLVDPVVTAFSVFLQWSDSDYEDSYYIERLDPGSSLWTVIAANTANVNFYLDLSVFPTNTYSYRVAATNGAGLSDYSVTKVVTTAPPPPPAAPSVLSASAISSGEIMIRWEDVLGESGYILERRTEDPLSWVILHVHSASGTGTVSFVDRTASAFTEYWYRIKAYNDSGESPYSNEDSATPMYLSTVLNDDFDPAIDPAMWTFISGGVATNFGNGFVSGCGLWFSGSTIRAAESIPMDLRHGGTLSFKIRAGNHGVDGWNNCETGETVELEYSLDGATWSAGQTLNTVYPSLSGWQSVSVAVPTEWMTAQTRLRWRQPRHSGLDYDVWALDDVMVVASTPPPPMSPSNGQIIQHRQPTFTWSATTGASWYHLLIDRNGTRYLDHWVEGVATWTPSNGLAGGNYIWSVQPWGASVGLGAWMGPAEFSIPVATPGALVQIAPEGPQGGHNLAYRWRKDANATHYRLWVGRMDAGTWHDVWCEISGDGEASVVPVASPPGLSKPTQSSPSGEIVNSRPTFQWAGSTCAWWLQGWSPDGYGPWSGPMSFVVPNPKGTWCRVFVNNGTANVIDQWTNGANFSPSNSLLAGRYSWWLGVWDPVASQTTWSDRMDFSILAESTGPDISGIQMDGGGRIVLRWQGVASMRYTLHHTTNLLQGFSVLASNWVAASPECAFTAMVNDAKTRFWHIGVEE